MYILCVCLIWLNGSMYVQVKNEAAPSPSSSRQRPVSDGVMYGNFNERRIEYEEVLLSERTESQYSQSESYLSERYVYKQYITQEMCT